MRNNILKKTIISILILVISIFGSVVFAENDDNTNNSEYPRFIIKSVEAKKGDVVEVDLSVKSAKSVASAALVVDFNKNLQFIECSNEDAYSVKHTSNYEDGKLSIVFVAQNGNIDADNKEVKVCTLKFKVPDDVSSNNVLDVSVRSVKDMCDNNGTSIGSFFTEKGTITVTDAQSSHEQNGVNNEDKNVIKIILIIMWCVAIICLICVIVLMFRKKKNVANSIESDEHISNLYDNDKNGENENNTDKK